VQPGRQEMPAVDAVREFEHAFTLEPSASTAGPRTLAAC
jgi:hypothetical protein